MSSASLAAVPRATATSPSLRCNRATSHFLGGAHRSASPPVGVLRQCLPGGCRSQRPWLAMPRRRILSEMPRDGRYSWNMLHQKMPRHEARPALPLLQPQQSLVDGRGPEETFLGRRKFPPAPDHRCRARRLEAHRCHRPHVLRETRLGQHRTRLRSAAIRLRRPPDQTLKARSGRPGYHLGATRTASPLLPARRPRPLKATFPSPSPIRATSSPVPESRCRIIDQLASRTSRSISNNSGCSSRSSRLHRSAATSGPALSVASEIVSWVAAIPAGHPSRIRRPFSKSETANTLPSVCVLPFRTMLKKSSLVRLPKAVGGRALASAGRTRRLPARTSAPLAAFRFCPVVGA